jgi:hypothetical protein
MIYVGKKTINQTVQSPFVIADFFCPTKAQLITQYRLHALPYAQSAESVHMALGTASKEAWFDAENRQLAAPLICHEQQTSPLLLCKPETHDKPLYKAGFADVTVAGVIHGSPSAETKPQIVLLNNSAAVIVSLTDSTAQLKCGSSSKSVSLKGAHLYHIAAPCTLIVPDSNLGPKWQLPSPAPHQKHLAAELFASSLFPSIRVFGTGVLLSPFSDLTNADWTEVASHVSNFYAFYVIALLVLASGSILTAYWRILPKFRYLMRHASVFVPNQDV